MAETPLFHLDFRPNALSARYAILPGDPGRVPAIAARLEQVRTVGSNREYVCCEGLLNGHPVAVCSTGIGGPSAAIAAEELHMAGVDTFIRVGTCGGMNLSVCAGDLVIAASATRNEGVTYQYAPAAFPAAADFAVTRALDDAAARLGYVRHVGTVHCKDSFYGQHSPERMPIAAALAAEWQAYLALGVLASEMESAALYTVAASLGCRAGCVLSALWNQERERAGLEQKSTLQPDTIGADRAIETAIAAVERLINNE